MSFAIGAASYAAQRLISLFSQIAPTPSTASDSSGASTAASSGATPASGAAPDNSLTGSTQPSLSDQILATLMQIQGADGTASSGTGATASGSTDPVQSLFNAMDTDDDGSVSQTEMESYLEKAGATQGQADAVYSALDPNGSSSGVSENQMAGALQQAQGSGGGHHHHHHHASGASSSNNPIDQLMSLLDGNQDGSVSQDEFSSVVTANGGTASEAATDFTALDSDKSGSLSSADFATAWQNIQNQQGGGSFVNTILDAFAKANGTAATAATTSVTA